MRYCEEAATPMNTNEKLQREDGTENADPRHFRSIIGGLNYLTHTRPVTLLAQFINFVQTQFSTRVLGLADLCEGDMKILLQDRGIVHQRSCSYTSTTKWCCRKKAQTPPG